MAVTSSVSEGGRGAEWFPSWFIWALFFLTSAFRVHYVLQPNNWWTLHPDEVYQALEEAHSEVYGYGFRAYEYNPPIDLRPDSPGVHRLHHAHGLAALRSHLLPHAYALVPWVLEPLGLEFNPYLTWKVAHTLAACTLLLAVHRYVRVVFRSRDAACLAAILCACSAQLHVLGTHTVVNSLLSAPVFWALARLHALLRPPSTEGATDGTVNQPDDDHASTGGQTVNHQNSTPPAKGKRKHKKPHQNQRSTPAANVPTNRGSLDNNGARDFRPQSNTAEKNRAAAADDSSRQNGVGAAESVITSYSPFRQKCGGFLRNLGAGFVLGVCVYIRVDLSALVVFTLLPHWSPFRARYADIIVCACGSVCGLAVGIVDDFRYYGWGVVTPYNWYRFNVQKDYSAILFGSKDWHQYVEDIFLTNPGMMALSTVCCLCGVKHMLFPQQSPADLSEHGEGSVRLFHSWQSSTVRMCASWLCLLVLYSSKRHKEMRFLHDVFVLILITWAVLLQSGVHLLFSSLKTQKCALAAIVVSFALSQFHEVAHLTDNPGRGGNKMAFQKKGDTQHVNQCLYFLSSRDDITGVFLTRNLYSTGGYCLMHKDVPVFTVFGDHFTEFSKEDRVVERAKNIIGPQKNITLTDTNKITNFVTLTHSRYAFKFVLEDPRYNYVVSVTADDLALFGLEGPVYRRGVFKVYRRPANPTSRQRQLTERILNTPPPTNSTLLLHEADVLYYYGAYRHARARYRLVLEVDPARVEAYLPLAHSHLVLGEDREAEKVMKECYRTFGMTTCEKTRDPLLSTGRVPLVTSLLQN